MARPEVNEARWLAIQAANVHRLERHLARPAASAAIQFRPRLLGARNWQQAVYVCRQFGLLPESLLRFATTGRVPQEVRA